MGAVPLQQTVETEEEKTPSPGGSQRWQEEHFLFLSEATGVLGSWLLNDSFLQVPEEKAFSSPF